MISEDCSIGERQLSYSRAQVMDTVRQDFFEATASRQKFRSDHGVTGN
jgi:hypothetical protein